MNLFKYLPLVLMLCVSNLTWALSIQNVSHNQNIFNPHKGEVVKIRFTVDKPSFVTAFIYDARDILLSKISSKGIVSGNNLSLSWDGRDQIGRIVPAEAYHYTLMAYSEDGESIEYDVTDNTGGETLNIKNIRWDKETKQIQYILPTLSRVNIRIGLKNRGPLMNSFLNWVPRVGGVHKTTWNGFDQSGFIDLSEHPNQEIGVLAFSLSHNTFLVGPTINKVQLIKELPWQIERRFKKKMSKKRMFSHSQQAIEQRGDFSIIFNLPNNLPKTKDGIPIITEKVAIKLDLSSDEQSRLFAQRFESVFYLDGQFIEESELGYIPMTWFWEPKNSNPGIHYLTANIRAYEGNFGTSTVRVFYQPKTIKTLSRNTETNNK